jgi:ubiquinone/menaquinone biosynthesis C-methylase UbiE
MRPQTDGPSGTASPDRDFAAWNEEMVERYDIERYYERSHGVVRWLEHRRLDALVELASPSPGERVLEVGCGGGHVLQRFSGVRRTGVDLSEGMIRRSRARLGPDVTLLRASAEQLPFDDGEFDIVVCTEVLEHVPDPAAVIAELTRVAAKGGRVVVSIPNEVNIDRIKRTIRKVPVLRQLLRTLASEGNEWHLHHFDLALLHRIVEGQAKVARLRPLPAGVLPLRYVALLHGHTENRRSA